MTVIDPAASDCARAPGASLPSAVVMAALFATSMMLWAVLAFCAGAIGDVVQRAI